MLQLYCQKPVIKHCIQVNIPLPDIKITTCIKTEFLVSLFYEIQINFSFAAVSFFY